MEPSFSGFPFPLDLPTFTDTAESLTQNLLEAESALKTAIETVLTCQPKDATFDSAILPMALAEGPLAICGGRAGLLEAASSDAQLRLEASKAHMRCRKIYESWFSRKDIFQRIQVVYSQLHSINLDAESKRLTEKWYHNFVGAGCELDMENSAKLTKIKEDIALRRADFNRVLIDNKDVIWLTRENLAGVTSSVLNSFQRNMDETSGVETFGVPLKHSTQRTVLAQVHDSCVRKAILQQYEHSVSAALDPFADVIRLRLQQARLLGSKSFATKTLERKMAGDPANIESFLTQLQDALMPLGREGLRNLEGIKRAESHDDGSDGFYVWDKDYYHEKHLERLYEVDNRQISEYFPVEPVLGGMLEIFEDVFAIKFYEVGKNVCQRLAVDPATLTWHKDVKMFTVWERDAKSQNDFIGYLYTDLFARQGKYSTCANFSIHPGFSGVNGERHQCATALLTNFPPPSSDRPSLLQHANVIQMFHELGHGMHDLLSRTRYAGLHGHRCPFDFVEMPSQMLENWCWTPSQLSSFTKHYSYISEEYAEIWKNEHNKAELPAEKLPLEVAEKLASTRFVDVLGTLRQIVLAKFDMLIHGESELSMADMKQWFHQKREEIGLIRASDTETFDYGHYFATTVHFIEGSACNYYSYLFSQVYSADIFHSAFKDNLRDSDVGKRYRRLILQPGGSRNPIDMLKDFLGREPKQDAFYHDIGIRS
ncbi:hypothetical protein PFICI_02355 [Pestalotiopsis fici W106-1]|uniref:Peptidase M3A/M3B catalytic domain-containing protein n=1 Tax=Pestalotiopsis fici (strain W106-1 / CGMCC3.15140) TaxID=1229662 RepID=W3XE60_PESFW|nr:uncharacterized protein PFICI_02355 [Pestalotiopsis fici W106-1]ETS84330.1 hypothetical protein PFICI_02355 [Pestalotiopsis fici W106-1]